MDGEQEIYHRSFDFGDWPVEDEEEFLSYAEWLVGVVRDNSNGVEPQTGVRVLRVRNSEGPMPLTEFRERLDEFPFDDMVSTSVEVSDPDGGLTVSISRSGHGLVVLHGKQRKDVRISGTDKARVEGVKAQIRQDGEGRIERLKEAEAEEEAERAAEAERDRRAETARQIIEADAKRERERNRPISREPTGEVGSEPDGPKTSLWQKFRKSPWAVQVFGGAIGGVLGVGSLALIAYIASQVFGIA